MSMTKDINEKLDEILAIRTEINRMKKDLNNNEDLINKITGEKCSKTDALDVVEKVIDGIKNDLSKITNNGQNCRDIFTNEYYINDPMEDKRIARNNKDNFSNQDWKSLYKISEETFVEETDSLKQKAAGAGLTDND